VLYSLSVGGDHGPVRFSMRFHDGPGRRIKAELHVFEAMPHIPFLGSPKDAELYDEQIRFMLAHMS
jgi:hypothetical protein